MREYMAVKDFLNRAKIALSCQKGMTLIDLSIALVVISLVAYPLVGEYHRYMRDKTEAEATEKMALANAAIDKFYLKVGRYPCPADIELAPGDPNYGLELFDNVQGFCVDVGGTLLNDPTQFTQGMVPFKTLSLPESDAYDPWHSRIVYAVTAYMASTSFDEDDYYDPAVTTSKPYLLVDGFYSPFAEDYLDTTTYATGDLAMLGGQMYQAVSDTTGNPPPDPTYWIMLSGNVAPATNDQTHYIIVSHGPNRVGAYNRDGTVTDACATGSLRETMNCDGDDLFFDRGMTLVGGAYGYSEAAGDDFFDDYTFFRSSTGSAPSYTPNYPLAAAQGIPGQFMMWSPEDLDTAAVKNQSFKVGIGYEDPDDALDVNGKIKVSSGDLMTAELCDENDENCFFTYAITGSKTENGEDVGYIWCEDGSGFAAAIQASDATCNTASMDYFGGFEGTCGGGQSMTGIVGGVIQCATSPF